VGPPGGVYAHEDLLSTTPASAGKPKPTRVGFFTQSFVVVEAVLPPPSTSPLVPLHTPIPTQLPPSVLSSGLPNPAIRWRPQPLSSMSDDLALYKTLAKARLSAFVVLTAMAGYAMCPTDPMASQAAMEALAQTLTSFPASTSLESLAPLAPSASSALTNSLSVSVLLPATVGTTLCAFSAASFNQVVEGPYDAQMARTRARPVPRRFVTPLHATTFGAITGTIGMGTLYFVNPLSASLGLLTILLYCPIYTLMKRHTIYNTWLGAVVGAIPPLIGWSACTGSLSVLTQPGAWALFLMMFFWQFPHFNALAHTLRSSYASSGYRMLSVLDPAKNALVALRYSVALLPLSFLFPPLGLTNWLFPFLALAPNGIMAVTAFRFWQKREEKRAKQLFWASLVHLPVVLGMAMVCKKGLFGTEDEEVYDEEDEEDEEELVGQMVKV
jgi:protoheme IX farnesyltransferase